ncbi:hypothetical protein FKW77_007376 [Venturia effusa]|uniref:Uncharacterized protein n=1 Tax=Venturia effusa TaxID=50376 RepID=A0A517L3N9_9PEZI|nr:hypothetical protein FKW77_007376 [Venturia effusa]
MASLDLPRDGTATDVMEEDWWSERNERIRDQAPNTTVEVIETEYVELPIDHFGDGQGTFKNRFWVAESGYKLGGPVFVYDWGEANASQYGVHLQRLRNNASFLKQLVDKFGGIGIVWEHRFYGNSSPHNVSLDTPATDFEFLTTEQALADLPTFAWGFKRKNFPNVDLTPAGTPWIFIGGSYPGMRAAFMRKYYPGTIFAAWASSAPVQAAVDMSFYFEPVWQGMRAQGWTNCTNDIQAAVLEMDKIMAEPARSWALKEAFLGRMAGNNSNAGFADALSTIFYLWQSDGPDGGPQGLRSFCDWISTDPDTNKTAPESGWAAIKGPDFTVNRWASWPSFAATVNDNLFTKCEGNRKINATTIPNCNLEERFPTPSSISWTWQYCTQWGFFQSANLGPHQLISKYNTLQHQADICHRQFPDGLKSGLLPQWPDVDTTNEVFGGWKIRPSNTLWTAGEWDPWRTLTPLSVEKFSPRYQLSREIPDCGRPFKVEKELFADILPNAQHTYEFRTSFNGSKVTRDLFAAALEKWLKCWRPPRPGNSTSPVDGGGAWGLGHFDPRTGKTGKLPDPANEQGWVEANGEKKKNFIDTEKRPSAPLPPVKPRRPRSVRTRKMRTVPLP